MVNLASICLEIKDGDWIESKDQSTEGIRLIQTGNIGDGVYIAKDDKAKYISQETFEKLNCTEIFQNDVLISRLPSPVGRGCIFPNIKERAITAVDCTILRINTNVCIPKYLVYYTKSNLYLRQIDKFTVGTTRLRISRKNLENIKIYLPHLEIQKDIVKILDKAQNLINKRKEQIEALDELVKSKFIEMFGDPINNPKGWTITTIGKLSTDVRYGTSKSSVEGGKYPYLRMNNITYSGYLDLNELKYIDIDDNELEKCIVRKGDVLFNRTNSADLIGKTCVFNLDTPMIIAGYIIRVRLSKEILPIYLSMFLNSDYGKKLLKGMAKGAVNQANINAQELKSIKIPLPPLELQNQFATFVQQVDKLKFEMQQSLKELEDNFNNLMQKAFNGELFEEETVNQ